jgi:hypothetical protein
MNMTLRVLLQIVPFGNEDKAYTIETVNISNVQQNGYGNCDYIIEHNKYKSGEKDLPMVNHNRQDGAIALVHKALEQLVLLKDVA